VKNAAVLEVLERVNTLAVDKTGTLTEGRPRVTECVPADYIAGLSKAGNNSEHELLRLAASVEQNSEHPLAQAIVEAAQERGIELAPVAEFESVTGGGVIGQIDGKQVFVGAADLLRERGVAMDESPTDRANQLRERGRTVVFVAVQRQLAGLVAIADPIRATTAEALAALRRLGLQVVMLTGDNEKTARAVARQLGIDQVEAGVKPDDKQQRVKALQESGRIVAMAGDGINDAPALAAADVGIAMGTGADVAIESSDITLVHGDLRGVVRAIQLSRKTMRNIRQNLFFAFGYNLLGVPVAAGVLVPIFGTSALLNPMIAAAAMSFSSVSVIANALRLRRASLS
jgi:Cu+-exporting ATPase